MVDIFEKPQMLEEKWNGDWKCVVNRFPIFHAVAKLPIVT